MNVLPTTSYSAVRALVHATQLHGHLSFAHAVLDGRHSGFILADDATHPNCALVCNDSGFYLAFGVPQPAWVENVIPELRSAPRPEPNSGVFGTTPAWEPALQRAFTPGGTESLRRLGFAYRPEPGKPPRDWRDRIPQGMHVEPLTTQLAQGIVDGTRTANYGIDPWFIRVAGGPQAYAADGLGMAILEGEQIAAICGYCSLISTEAELEVGTVPAYCGRNLATLASAAFIEQCDRAGLLPVYTCDSNNAPSRGVARKLGFVEVEEITGYKL